MDAYHHPLTLMQRDFAYNRTFIPCLLARGYDLGAGPPLRNPAEGVTLNAVGRQLFNLALAEEYGYSGPTQAPPPEPPQEVYDRLNTPEGQEASEECSAQAQAVTPPSPSQDLLSSLEVAAYSSANQADAVLEAAEEWRACMASLGVPDLPSGPQEMPTGSQRQLFDPDRARDGTPGAEEVRQAVTDARCRETSGWSTALYEEEWRRQVALIPDNEDAFERLRAANEAHAAAIEEALAGVGE
jgi:hypothetical protein